MSLEETFPRSPLDKPLHQLTEDDISQLTREDCRRFLKEKGMRRPSWNKSQAIQQVISLKTLLDTTPDSDAGARKKLLIPRPQIPHRVQKRTSPDTPISVSAEESVPFRRKDPEKPEVSGDSSGLNVAHHDSIPARSTGATNGQAAGQMTIFYCGKVNVYDNMPADKAQVIMQLAASPLHLPLEGSFDATTARQPFPCRLQAASVKVGPGSPMVLLPTSQTAKIPDNCCLHKEENSLLREENTGKYLAEGSANRKASIQRYREKRKDREDRFKSKRKVGTPSSASSDIYLNHQTGGGSQTMNEHSSRSDACSSVQIRPPNMLARSGFIEDNIVKNANISADHNGKDTQA